jgi:hypothetical protein
MQPEIHTDSKTPPVDRGYAVSMVIKQFKGHADVEVHLFRPTWDEEDYGGYPWEELIGGAISDSRPEDPENSKSLILETFTAAESQRLMDYLRERYADRLASIQCHVLDFPVPLDLTPLSSIRQTDTVGRLDLDQIPNYSLDFPVKGIYDLSRHDRLQGPD